MGTWVSGLALPGWGLVAHQARTPNSRGGADVRFDRWLGRSALARRVDRRGCGTAREPGVAGAISRVEVVEARVVRRRGSPHPLFLTRGPPSEWGGGARTGQ